MSKKKNDDFDLDFDFMDFDFGGVGDAGDIFGLKAKPENPKPQEKFDLDAALDDLIQSKHYRADVFKISHKYAKQLREKGFNGAYHEVFGEALRRIYKYAAQLIEFRQAHGFDPNNGGGKNV